MSDSGKFSDQTFDLKSTDIKEIEKHYQRIITYHIELARLPTFFGWTNRVMMSLQMRLGKSPLEIADIAQELDIPTRTLQSHLSQEGTNFSNLRDLVRKHYAIEYLLEGKRVEDIFPMLDFKDRTGLINAFKRWTGLPPNHFRKLYNVYVKGKI
ncbi:helix-turn-helix domain-containing protein [Agarilytica rhodophyticola]|uniref:helix-turn-helix domain-containing protein n=1 Tax=Agarilytica rhodophyticola TaxID=1737490 RepID=UPI000B3440F4|nr:helix-turn-helix domain-containing protein [Agarilytica rhodophyticola]